jgi:hypothetical protein
MSRSRRKSRQLSRRDTAVQLRGGRAKLVAKRRRGARGQQGGMPWPPVRSNGSTEGESLTRATEARPRATTGPGAATELGPDLGGQPT